MSNLFVVSFVVSFDASYAQPYRVARFVDLGMANAPYRSPFAYFETHAEALAHVAARGGKIIHDDTTEG